MQKMLLVFVLVALGSCYGSSLLELNLWAESHTARASTSGAIKYFGEGDVQLLPDRRFVYFRETHVGGRPPVKNIEVYLGQDFVLNPSKLASFDKLATRSWASSLRTQAAGKMWILMPLPVINSPSIESIPMMFRSEIDLGKSVPRDLSQVMVASASPGSLGQLAPLISRK